MIKSLTHVAVRVTDLGRAEKFYCNLLGFQKQFSLEKDGEACLTYLRAGDTFIELFPGAQGHYEDHRTPGPVHFCLLVDDIQEEFHRLKSQGLNIEREPHLGGDNAWQFWI